ncbi:MAG: ISL3 family transposase [Oscillospiraceae bacterium]|nr:ISL3 family transposase [Oscillospiraceae bacterium]
MITIFFIIKDLTVHSAIKNVASESLGLTKDWKVTNYGSEENCLTIHVEHKHPKKICCPNCNKKARPYSYVKERRWRHTDVFSKRCFVICKRPRIKCEQCGVITLLAPYERKHSRFTKQYEAFALMLIREMPMSKAAEILRCNEKSVYSILQHWVIKAEHKRTLENVKNLAIDETSVKKKHDYITIVVDSDKSAVIDVQPGKGKSAITNFKEKLEQRDGDSSNIETVSSDMSPSFMPAIEENFPNAFNILDRFHIVQMLNKAVNDVRKIEQREANYKKELFLFRKLLFKNKDNLTPEQNITVNNLIKNYPKTGKAYNIKASFLEIYKSDTVEEASEIFDSVISWMRRCRLYAMKRLAKVFKRRKQNILAYITFKKTNAVCEGINSGIQAAKRKAKGYQTLKNLVPIIYLISGKLELDIESPLI